MNIWTWVTTVEEELRENGNTRLADAIDAIPSYTCGDEHEKVDQLYPEALSLVRKENNPWLEVFVRHWYLQSQVLHRHNVKGMLGEAVDLLEFSSRPSTKECPQSICVVQDLANCYAKKDGPAYVEERIAVSTETITKINPEWPCYVCICDEYISALVDTKDYRKALQEITFHREAIAKTSQYHEKTPFSLVEANIYIKQGDYQRAEEIARAAENPEAGDSFLKYKSAAIALALAYQGKFDEALSFELSFEDVIKAQSHYLSWCEYNLLKTIHNPSINDEGLNACFNKIVENFVQHGVLRDTITVLNIQAELAVNRDDLFTLSKCITNLESTIAQLSQDLGASDILKKLRLQYDEKKETLEQEIQSGIQSIHSRLASGERLTLTELELATNRAAGDVDLDLAFFDLLVENGYWLRALEIAEKFFAEVSDPSPFLSRYGYLLLDENRLSSFDEFFNRSFVDGLPESARLNSFLMLAHRNESESPDKALEYINKILHQVPDSEIALEKAAIISTKTEKYAQALNYWTRLIELNHEENKHYHWDRMIAATIIEDWQSVRESSALLEIELEQESGRVEQDMGRVRIQLNDSTGNTINLVAKRTGPVQATICSIRPLDEEQFFGDQLVFDATPLNKLDQEDEEGYACDSEGYYTYLYSLVKMTQSNPHFIFAIDGVHPGNDNWHKIEQLAESYGIALSVRSSEEYQVRCGEDGLLLSAIYVFAASPENLDLSEFNRELSSLVEAFEYPLIWPLLLLRLNERKALEKQVEIEQLYGLD